jgi:hypothetical protein
MNLITTTKQAFNDYLVSQRIKIVYVDVDKTLLIKEAAHKGYLSPDYVALPHDIHGKYDTEPTPQPISYHAPPALDEYSYQYAQQFDAQHSFAPLKERTTRNSYYKAKINIKLVECLKHFKSKSDEHKVMILSTGGWQHGPFTKFFKDNHELKFDGFFNNDNVKDKLSYTLRPFAKGRAFHCAEPTLLIDDQWHQRMSFSAQWNGFSLDPGPW